MRISDALDHISILLDDPEDDAIHRFKRVLEDDDALAALLERLDALIAPYTAEAIRLHRTVHTDKVDLNTLRDSVKDRTGDLT